MCRLCAQCVVMGVQTVCSVCSVMGVQTVCSVQVCCDGCADHGTRCVVRDVTHHM